MVEPLHLPPVSVLTNRNWAQQPSSAPSPQGAGTRQSSTDPQRRPLLSFGAGQQTNRRRQDLKGTYVKQKALACFGQGAGIWGRLAERKRTRPWGAGPPGRRRPEEKKGVRAGAKGSRPPPHRPRSRPLTTYHLDNLGLPARLLLHGEDVLGQHHPADQRAHASAGHRAHLRHGGPVHGSSQGHGEAPRAAAGKRPLAAEGGRRGGWRGRTSAPARAGPQRPPDPATTAPHAPRRPGSGAGSRRDVTCA